MNGKDCYASGSAAAGCLIFSTCPRGTSTTGNPNPSKQKQNKNPNKLAAVGGRLLQARLQAFVAVNRPDFFFWLNSRRCKPPPTQKAEHFGHAVSVVRRTSTTHVSADGVGVDGAAAAADWMNEVILNVQTNIAASVISFQESNQAGLYKYVH